MSERFPAPHLPTAYLQSLPAQLRQAFPQTVLMTTTIQQRQGASAWNQFCDWVTSTNNRLYVGWFGAVC
jgi:hypothetical protein